MAKYSTQSLQTAQLKDLSWLTGKWLGQKDGWQIEEHWSTPAGPSMMGMFRCYNETAVRFYELLAIEKTSSGLVMRIKHFSEGFKGWEEKEESTNLWLVELGPNRAIFSKEKATPAKWLIYSLAGEDELHAHFEEEGASPTAPYKYLRAD